ncbi:MAG: selenocysteine-specific translation elongation factor [Bryobacterales bacterium]|nr:selenocysteine-specific translation elongation factor [Bryobacterales bacterium]
MIHCIIGTAGHIDHGKTALVRALTGIDTDRLEEEKRRGISIDLGFAHLALTPEIQCGFVDVPGHERFVKNMLAGVGGIDLVLLVVSAEESIKPQTREHFDICRLLGIRRGIVVLTKADLMDADILELVRMEVEEFVAGSFLEGAPIVPVSAVTRAGLDELKAHITKIAKSLPARDTARHFRLPVDRAFAVKGFGAVVTGTLVAGAVRPEQEVELHPQGMRVRVRGVQVHGKPATKAVAGQRTAINLGGVDHGEIHRGMTLSEAGVFRDTKSVDCVLDLLDSAKPLKHRAPVHFHAGTAEIEAEVRLMDRAVLKPGERAYARLVLREPTLLLPGDRFILRMFSPVITIAGGQALDAAPPRKLKGGEVRLKVLEQGTAIDRVRLLLSESACGMSMASLVARTGLTTRDLTASIAACDAMWIEAQQWAVSKQWISRSQQRTKEVLAAFHKQNPLQPGLSREELRSREFARAPAFLVEALWKSAPGITMDGEVLRLSSHKLALKGDEEQALKKIEDAFQHAGLTVPAAQDVLKSCGVDAVRARSLLQILLREKRVVKVSEDLLFHPSAIALLRETLAAHKGQRFSVPEFKEWTGVSRKYAIPLLEYLDRERATRREGDVRVVL